jgi:hypothetical protein
MEYTIIGGAITSAAEGWTLQDNCVLTATLCLSGSVIARYVLCDCILKEIK